VAIFRRRRCKAWNRGGFKLYVEDRAGLGWNLYIGNDGGIGQGYQTPALGGPVFEL